THDQLRQTLRPGHSARVPSPRARRYGMNRMKLFSISLCLCTTLILPATVALVWSDSPDSATEAPTGYRTPTYADQAGEHSVSNGLPLAPGETFGEDQAEFEASEGVDDGLGPVFNARSCADCHQTPVTGGSSQVTEFRAGHSGPGNQFQSPSVVIAH